MQKAFLFMQSLFKVVDPALSSLQQQTEWQRYLRQSLEVVAKVMELLPTHAFSTLVSGQSQYLVN